MTWLDTGRILGLLLWPQQGRARLLYRTLSRHNCLGNRTLYQNLGYWKAHPADYDAACDALAEQVGMIGKLAPGDRVLDCGFGFADQDLFWMRRFEPESITGVNVTAEQIPVARERIAAAGLADRVRLTAADAVRLPFAPESFDVVVSLESAFHYRYREDFFREALRVLRPGGRLAMADLAGTGRAPSLRDRAVEFLGRSFWQIPAENLYTKETYRDRLAEAGFANIELQSIGEHVYPPFVEHIRDRIGDPEIAARMHPLLWHALRASLEARRELRQLPMDYLLAGAVKP